MHKHIHETGGKVGSSQEALSVFTAELIHSHLGNGDTGVRETYGYGQGQMNNLKFIRKKQSNWGAFWRVIYSYLYVNFKKLVAS